MAVVKRIAFDELLPDMPFVGETNGMAECENLLPLHGRWRMLPAAVEVASSVAGHGTLEEILSAKWSFARKEVIFGTNGFPGGELYRVNEGGGAMVNVSKGGGPYADLQGTFPFAYWSFTEFDDWMIAAQIEDPVQYLTAAGAAFADLFTSVLKPKAKHCCTSKVHLVLGWTNEGGTDFPRRIRWSAQGDPQDMDDGSARAGHVDLDSGDGEIVGLAGFDDFFLVWTESKVIRFDYVGGDEVWFPAELGAGAEAMLPSDVRSIVKIGNGAAYLGRNGFYLVAGSEIAPIGEGKTRSIVKSRDTRHCAGAADGHSGLIVWETPVSLAVGGTPEMRRLTWNPIENRFSVLDEDPIVSNWSHIPVYAPLYGDREGIQNLVFLVNENVGVGRLVAFRQRSATYVASTQRGRIVEAVPGEVSSVLRVRPLVDLETEVVKTNLPNVQVEIRGYNDAFQKTAAFSAVTLDTATHSNATGWLSHGLPVVAQRFEFLVKVPGFDGSDTYVPINLLGLDVEFDQFTEF